MFDISLKCQWEVGCGAGGLKVGPVIKFIRSDRLPMRERDICCYGQNPLLRHYHHSLLGSMRSTRIIEDICIFTPSPPTTDYLRSESLNSLLSKLKLISLSSGILVVNVQWRGRAYVGTLFDSSRQKNINQNR